MNILKSSVLIVVAAIALWAVAAAPVAVRVEIETLEVGAEGTPVILTIQISPEDRSRIGKNAMVRITLDGDTPPGQSPLWAVRIESDASGRIETVWPPGEHALRVEISNPRGEDSGLWVGTVRIPGADPVADAEEEPAAPAPKPDPTPEPQIRDEVAAAPAGSATAEPPPAAEEPEEIAETSDDVVPVESLSDSAEIPAPEEIAASPPEPGVVAEREAATAVEEMSATPDEIPVDEEVEEVEAEASESEPVSGVSPEAAGAVGTAAAPKTEPPVEPAAVAEAPAAEPPPPPQVEKEIEPEAAVVEPLRGATPEPDLGTGSGVLAPPESSMKAPEPPPAEVVAALEAWTNADPATADLTVIVLRDNEPATGLEASDFDLRVGGEGAVIEEVGGRDRAPLQLGIAVDVAKDPGVAWSQSGGRLYSLVERARGGRGHVFFAAGGRIGEWDGGPGDPRVGAGSAGSGDLTSLIVDSLERFEGRRGRKFLVVVTDGRLDADKAAWQRATEAAEKAGVPVFVIALWDESFSHRIRKNLKSIANVSGGGLFLVQGSDQLDRAADRFGPMIDAGVAIRFVVPPGVVLPAQVAVSSSDRKLELTAPKAVR